MTKEQLQAECKEWERIFAELENEYWKMCNTVLPAILDPFNHGSIMINREAYDKVIAEEL